MSASHGNLPVELYRPIVESITTKCDLISFCLVCRAMRDEAERILYSAVRLTPSTESLAIQLRDNHRQRRHISQFGISTTPYPPKTDLLNPLLRILPDTLTALDLFHKRLGERFYKALSTCHFPCLVQFRCDFYEHSSWEIENAACFGHVSTFLLAHPTIERLYWKGDTPDEFTLQHHYLECLPRVRFVEVDTMYNLILFLLRMGRPITHFHARRTPPVGLWLSVRASPSNIRVVDIDLIASREAYALLNNLPGLRFVGNIPIYTTMTQVSNSSTALTDTNKTTIGSFVSGPC